MNVLIVSENFLNGGLETQIDTTVKMLEANNNFYFAVSKYNESWNYNNIYTDFCFSYNSTTSQFYNDVNNLVKIIEEKNIDIIHVHPFYSFFPAVFAAKLCRKPIIYTYHGIASYNFPSMANDKVLFNLLLDYELDKILCVSIEGKQIIQNILLEKNKAVFLPNSINTSVFTPTNINNNKHWALISRLDTDKINELLLIINNMQFLDISGLHIYGNGTEEAFLKDYINQNNLEDKVFFEGYSHKLYEDLQGKYNGVFAIGRSAMESISMNYPVILLGYNKLSGVINDNTYSFLKEQNFSNKLLPDVSIELLSEQIQNIYNNNYSTSFYEDFENEFDAQIVAKKYYDELQNIPYNNTFNFKKILGDLKKTNQDALFYDNIEVFNCLKNNLQIFCRIPHQNNMFLNAEFIIKQKHELDSISDLLNYKQNIEAKITEHDNAINLLNKNTMTLGNLKRKIKNKFKH